MNKTYDNVIYNCNYKIVWCPKDKAPILVGDIESRFIELINAKSNKMDAELLHIDVRADYVSLTLACAPYKNIHSIVKNLKTFTSKKLLEEFSELKSSTEYLWTKSYLCHTLGSISEESINEYIGCL